MLPTKTLITCYKHARCFSSAITTFQQHIDSKDIINYNGANSDKDFIPLHQYFLKFSYFHVQLPSINNLSHDDKDYYPIDNIKCKWNYTNDIDSLFNTQSMQEYELTTAKLLVKYFRKFPFNYYNLSTFTADEEKLFHAIKEHSPSFDIHTTFNSMYTALYESKCTELFGNNMNDLTINLPLAQNVIKDFVFNFNVQVNGNLIKRNNLSLRENDHLQIDVPSSEIFLHSQRRLLQYLFSLNGLTKKERRNNKYKLYQIYSVKNRHTMIQKLMEKLCLTRFNENMVHGIRHFIVPKDIKQFDDSDIILYEDDDIIICNKPSGMACHFAPDTQKYHNDSLINYLLYHCPELQRNIQKDSTVLKSGVIAHSNVLPSKITELQLTISPGIVHRIDKQSSGIIVIGKTIFAMNNLFKQWEYHKDIEREYIVLCHGKFDGNELRQRFKSQNSDYAHCNDEYYQTLREKHMNDHDRDSKDPNFYKCECWIGPKLVKKRAVGPLRCFDNDEYEKQRKNYDEDEAKKVLKMSCTDFYKLKEYEVNGHIFTLLKCKLITGRTHQIRLHSQYLGMSVVGDRMYPRIKDQDMRLHDKSKKIRPDKEDNRYMTQDVDIEMQCLGLEWRNYDCHALHAQTLRFQHPMTGKEMNITAEIPAFFKTILNNIDEAHCQKLQSS